MGIGLAPLFGARRDARDSLAEPQLQQQQQQELIHLTVGLVSQLEFTLQIQTVEKVNNIC